MIKKILRFLAVIVLSFIAVLFCTSAVWTILTTINYPMQVVQAETPMVMVLGITGMAAGYGVWKLVNC